MARRCPLCHQELPKGLDEHDLHERLDHLSGPAISRERKRWEQEARALIDREREAARERALKQGRAESKSEIADLARCLQDAERKREREVELAGKRAAMEVAKRNQADMRQWKERTAREHAQHQAETARLKTTIDALQLRLERQTSEQLGEQGEVNVFSLLTRAFPRDEIERVGRGVRGADIIHRVIEDGPELGRIVYECKNVSTWQNEWVAKAKKYRSEYQTPWVVIASRTFPRKAQWFTVEKSVPIIDLRLAVSLAEIIRASIVESGNLRLSRSGSQAKAQQMFDYILSDHFAERFRDIAEAITGLRDHQAEERRWHEHAWEKQSRIHERIQGRHREIGAKIKGISGLAPTRVLQALPAQQSS